MTNADAGITTDVAQREAAGVSNGLLSKFARSPSRKHKPRPSSESAGLSEAGLAPPGSTAAAAAARVRPRPGTQRTTTAPAAAPVTLNALKAELVARSDSDGPGYTGLDANLNMYAVPITSQATTLPPSALKTIQQSSIPDVPPINGAQLAAQLGAGIPNPNTLYQHIHDMSSKRIATLDYMRKAHEGRTFWFNTVQFSKTDVSRLPSYTPNRLSRRATNYLLLGMSIPAVLDVHPPPHPQNSSAANAAIAQDYLKNLNHLLTEFENFQQYHPPDGSSSSSLSRARIPQMFKRAATTSRPRKSSGAVAEIGAPLQNTVSAPAMPEGGHGHSHQTSLDTTYSNSTFASSASTLVASTPVAPSPNTGFPTASAFPPPAAYDAPNSTLLPHEGPYTHLLTPPLPFAPDFYTVFATLCDVIIDAYQRLIQLLSSPAVCTPSLSDMFSKADARLRKVMVGGIVRDFENASRESAKRELMGVQKVVLGGLMGT